MMSLKLGPLISLRVALKLPLILLTLALLMPPAVAAQDSIVVQDTTRRVLVGDGQFDRPYLTKLLGRTAIGGYAEAHARLEREDGVTEEAGFSAKRWNLFTATSVSDFVRIGAELEFEDGVEEIRLEYAAIDLGIHQAFSLRAGMLLSPLGKFNLSHDSPRNEFTDRPLVSTDIIGVALSEPGVGAFGSFGAGGAGRVSYELYAVNGFNEGLIERSSDGTRIALGRDNVEDNNSSPAFVGRVSFSPRAGMELGFSAHHGAWNVFRSDGLVVSDRHNLTIMVADAQAAIAGFKLQGEAVTARIGIPKGLVGLYAERQQGFYFQAVRSFGRGWVRTMRSSRFAAGARVDLVDYDTRLTGDSDHRLSLGVTFHPTEDTAIKWDYVRGIRRDRFNNRGDAASLMFSVATYF